MKIRGIYGAELEFYPVPSGVQKKKGIFLIFPGGGYSWLSSRESVPVAAQLNSAGYEAAVLSYDTENVPLLYVPFQQAAWGVGYLRLRSPETPVFVIGFSAGAHCAGTIGVHWDGKGSDGEDLLEPVRSALLKDTDIPAGKEEMKRRISGPRFFRPDRMVLAYPVITAGPYAHRGSFERLAGKEKAADAAVLSWFSLETQVKPDTPETFLWQTAEDESVPVQNSLLMAQKLIENGVPTELHIYPHGVHGLSLATEEVAQPEKRRLPDPHVAEWFGTMLRWAGSTEAGILP